MLQQPISPFLGGEMEYQSGDQTGVTFPKTISYITHHITCSQTFQPVVLRYKTLSAFTFNETKENSGRASDPLCLAPMTNKCNVSQGYNLDLKTRDNSISFIPSARAHAAPWVFDVVAFDIISYRVLIKNDAYLLSEYLYYVL